MNKKIPKQDLLYIVLLAACCALIVYAFFGSILKTFVKDNNDTSNAIDIDDRQDVNTMHTSQEVIERIAFYEGFSKNAVWDINHYSIGFGSTACSKNETISYQDAILRLLDDVQLMESSVRDFALKNNIMLNQNQFDALVSFCHNLGYKALDKYNDSTLVKMIKSGEYNEQDLIDEWCLFCKAGGKEMKALKERRLWEAKLFLR